MADSAQSACAMADLEGENNPETEAIIAGLPADVGKLCLAKLPLDAVARSRAVCRSWASALQKYPATTFRQPHFLAFFLLGHGDDRFVSWLFLLPSSLRTYLLPCFFLTRDAEDANIYTSGMQIITTGTPLLLVRANFRLGIAGEAHTGGAQNELGEGHVCEPGLLQGFDLWRMRWLAPGEIPWKPMHVDRSQFAASHLGNHVYIAGGDGIKAANSAERLSLETWTWEMLPEMHIKRKYHASGFLMMGRFFVIGGEPHVMSTLPQSGEFYDPTTNSWTLVPGMWPHELWFAGGAPQSVTVVNDVAYAIDAKLQALVQLKVEDHPFAVNWHVVGKLPWADLEKASMLWMQCLVSDGKDKLWAILKNCRDQELFVFACTPRQGFVWERLHFVMPASHQHISSKGMGIFI